MRRSIFSFAVAAFVIATPALAGETLTNQAARVTVTVPDNWKAKPNGEELTLMDKKEDTAVALTLIDSGDLKDASKRLGASLSSKIQKLVWIKEEKVDVNGMKGIELIGDGRLDGKDIDLAVLILDTPNPDKDLLVLAIAEDAVLAKHKGEIKFVFRNLKPIK
ncbi:MAG TPA: hypothetical protein VIF62_00675 [Labilithrix sp.]|jgi:hypothetical protein